ncbi:MULTISPECIES: Lrp/AsnC family transcriptional regulator [unclassified Paenibacillus]|uniref:Lrp/AsnC family transcriptional regulator n=1 Tax=unclassified Paenibacillus TaxID=185978 RepID=UPI0024068948|nr:MULTISPECIES: Lrp/AsnC family transcriptional regulator [unclassified Paenibacillus]MDF9842239.1 Lrp/AsnC family leucine-responsive transcriptional regulator [Paenibacillus sp. PastF-2]MDF9848884.1 Lrp/AsnC family leucine-responsive transcriptional regulator [Paenibacillus sp. PastM-2]MDF9855454.1 Lrp/AsnC family leucine-responsive transcriptional regulator [Paenibacillus sp. PastF-1]MDH6480670.1 Lrp/AsnC family leucine-responsive transcriptional regulator [Paenibacillus sp. PastH-2]MDH6508
MDSLDKKIINTLMANGRITWSELAGMLGLSSPAAADRVRRLEEQGVIKGYTALIDSESTGYSLAALVAVSLERPAHRQAFLTLVQKLPEIQECHHTAGDDDYILKIRCRGTRDLDRIISEELKGLPGIVRTRTTIILGTVKEIPNVPLPDGDSGA